MPEIHVVPVGADGRSHQQARMCHCKPGFAIDIRSHTPADDIKVFLHRDPAVQAAEVVARKGRITEVR